MGTFLDVVPKKKHKRISLEKDSEYKERLKHLLNAGGMMELNCIHLCHKDIRLLEPVDFQRNGDLEFHYHYICDEIWEDAGFSHYSQSVFSHKVGWDRFNQVMKAAYVLELLYKGDQGFVLENNEIHFIEERIQIAWINYLFQEHYLFAHEDRWEAYLLCLDECKRYSYRFDERTSEYDSYLTVISSYEIKAVEYGLKRVIDGLYVDKLIEKAINKLMKNVREYKEHHNQKDTYRILIDYIQLYINDHISLSDLEDENIKDFCLTMIVIDSVVLPLKVIAEIYELDFWELYHQIKHKPRKGIYQDKPTILYISTASFLGVHDDDLLYYWKEDGDIKISDKTKEWFEQLYHDYLQLLKEEIIIEDIFEWTSDILEFVYKNYFYVFAFLSFFKDTITHAQDQKYLAVWKLLENMSHDQDMLNQGSVVFADEDGEEHTKLYTSWSLMPSERKNNPARIKLKRYLALLANKELRNKVFHF